MQASGNEAINDPTKSKMLGTSPPGLTARDFHPSCINPRDIFPSKSRQRLSGGAKVTPSKYPQTSYPALPRLGSPFRLFCCGEETDDKPNGCVKLGPVDDVPSPDSCEGDCDTCEDCFEDHKECDEDQIPCVDNCDECLDEHEKACGQQGQVCTETCDDCDFSCFDCVDWSAFEKDKDLGLSFSVPLLNQSPGLESDISQDVATLSAQTQASDADPTWNDTPVPPVNMYMHHQCLQNSASSWNDFCSGFDPMSTANSSQQTFESSPMELVRRYGCHPATLHTQQTPQQPLPTFGTFQQPLGWGLPAITPQATADDSPSSDSVPSSGRVCQWIMPCGNTCSATFASISDLRKHLKAVHCTKGTTKCSWASCTASFATEAALTGHISKKHLSNSQTEESGPFKCTFPGCTKSFMYKQVLTDHVASHSGTNKTYCHICKQFLNSEGSNFRRHMASHRPKHQHMICKWHHLGCKRAFPRLDNLRRHEGCCKFGKKAALHHHHFHNHKGHGGGGYQA